MKIAFDLRRIKNPGIGRYMQCLVDAVLAQESEHEFLLVLPPDAQDAVSIDGRRAQKRCCSSRYYSLREQLDLPRILRLHKIDLLHSPHFLLPLVRPCPAVVTIHDVIYLACKEDLASWAGRLYYRGMMGAATRMAARIITDSEYSKADIVRRLRVDPARIEVIYPGVSAAFQQVTDSSRLGQVRRKYSICDEFILYAGIYKPRKNHAGLLRAFRKLRSGCVDAQLVIAGPVNEGKAELLKLALELGIAGQVVFTGHVDDSELSALYSAARVYACPSLYEGFGFTVLEAMACGTPVVCSPETSLPEVAGDAALYADSRNPEEFAGALLRVFSDDALRGELIQKGRRNCRRFNWDKTAVQTLAVYEQSAGNTTPKAVYA
ncbi:MAG TPA: glycosyltransferase family 1 protein [Candidatus Angelobacter sp.]|nr:glycosyltransferase family 1 protein [Candidatus Angelobacter sp.]